MLIQIVSRCHVASQTKYKLRHYGGSDEITDLMMCLVLRSGRSPSNNVNNENLMKPKRSARDGTQPGESGYDLAKAVPVIFLPQGEQSCKPSYMIYCSEGLLNLGHFRTALPRVRDAGQDPARPRPLDATNTN